MLNERKGYQRKFWPRSGILVKIKQGARYNPPQNWITKTLPQVYIENLVQMIACCDTRGLIPTSSLILSGSQLLLKVSMALLICNYLYLTKALSKCMGWYPIKSFSKRLSYSENSSESQQHLFLTLMDLKRRMKFEHFFKRLAQLCESWKKYLNYTLDSLNRASVRTLKELIPLMFYGVMLLNNKPRYWR